MKRFGKKRFPFVLYISYSRISVYTGAQLISIADPHSSALVFVQHLQSPPMIYTVTMLGIYVLFSMTCISNNIIIPKKYSNYLKYFLAVNNMYRVEKKQEANQLISISKRKHQVYMAIQQKNIERELKRQQTIHGQFERDTKSINVKGSCDWITKGEVERKTESLLAAAQDQTLNDNSVRISSINMLIRSANSMSRFLKKNE